MKIETRIYLKSFSIILNTLLIVFLIGISSASAQKALFIFSEKGAVSILPHLVALADPTGILTIAEILSPDNQEKFVPLNEKSLKTNNGTFWLRFSLTGLNIDKDQDNYLLDLGQNITGIADLYVAKIDVKEQKIGWEKIISSNNSIFLFPKEDKGISIVYIKLQGHPGLWFDPVLRSTNNAATTYDHMSRYVLLATLFIMMLFCLIRGLSERSAWCFWTSLYLSFVMVKTFLGIPATPHGVLETDAMAIAVLPGISFIILVHIARILMQSTNTASRSFGWQYLVLIIPGIAMTALPLIPNYSWTMHYLELWPLAILLLVPTTLGAWLSGIYGSRRFLLGCLIPPIFTGLAIFGIGSGIPSDLLATIPLWGVVFGTLAIMSIGNIPHISESTSLEDVKPKDATAIAMQDPSLRIVNEDEENENVPIIGDDCPQEKDVNNKKTSQDIKDGLAWEEKLRVPLDTLCIEILALKEHSLLPTAQEHVERINDLANILNEALRQPLDSLNDCKDLDVPLGDDNFSFDLQRIMRKAYDSVSDVAEQKNIALSWFMPPVLGNKYVGNGQSLLHCLRLLLNNAVRATNQGAVKMSVRRVPESTDTGHLLFSVTDTGLGMPPYRSSASLGRVWELVASHKGFFGIECSPDGVSISFTLRLQAYTKEHSSQNMGYGGFSEKNVPLEDHVPENYPKNEQNDNELVMEEFNNSYESKSDSSIIIVDYSLSNRQLLTFFLEGLPFYTREAKTPDECVELHLKKQALLIIFDASLPLEEIFNAINKIRAFEMEKGLPSSLILALTDDKSQWVELHDGGCTHAMEKPITRLAFRNTIQDLLYELVGVFPTQDEQFASKEFSSNNDDTPYNDEKEIASVYGDSPLDENIGDAEKNLGNVQSLDDFVSPEPKQFIGSSYNERDDFESDILPYASESNTDFIDEKDSIKIIYEDDKSDSSAVEDFDNNQNNDFDMSEYVNILQGKTIQETLDENIHETLDQLNDDYVGGQQNDEFMETNAKPEAQNVMETPAIEHEKAQKDSAQDIISGAELLQQNSELKELITEDEYKFFDEAINKPFEKETKIFEENVKEDQVVQDAELSFHNNDLKGEVAETSSDLAFQEPIPAPIAEEERDEKSQHRPSLIPQSSFLTDYFLDDTPTKISNAADSNADRVNNIQGDLEINTDNKVIEGSEVPAFDNKDSRNNSVNNALLSMLDEVKEPIFEREEVKDSHPLDKLGLNVEFKATNGIDAQNNLFLNMDAENDVAYEKLSNEPSDEKNDNMEQEFISAPEQNIMSPNNFDNINDDVERENKEIKNDVEQTNNTDIDRSTSLSHVLESDDTNTSSPIPILLDELDKSIKYAKDGYGKNDVQAVLDAAAYIAKRTEACGLRSLSRIALCVEEAAKANDFNAISDLLPELETAIARNRESLQATL